MKKEIVIYKGRYFGVDTKFVIRLEDRRKIYSPDFFKIGKLAERIRILMLLGDRNAVEPFGVCIKAPLMYLYSLEDALGEIDPEYNVPLSAAGVFPEVDFNGVSRRLFLNGLLRVLSECDDVEYRALALQIANNRRAGVYEDTTGNYIL